MFGLASGVQVGNQAAAVALDLILEHQFALSEALDLDFVDVDVE
jgi:hypothetical protein